MRISILIALLAVLFVFRAQAQYDGDIIMHKTFWGTQFMQDGRMLKPRQVLDIMKVNEAAFTAFKRAKSNYDASTVLGAIGGFLIGWPIGSAIAGGDPQWGLAAAGGGILLIAIPMDRAFRRHAEHAITLYNGGPAARASSIRIDVAFYGAGAMVRVKFN